MLDAHVEPVVPFADRALCAGFARVIPVLRMVSGCTNAFAFPDEPVSNAVRGQLAQSDDQGVEFSLFQDAGVVSTAEPVEPGC